MGDISTEPEKPKGNPNPSPLTRFGAENGNPPSPGGWRKEISFSYQYKRFMAMSVEELNEWLAKPETEKLVVEDLAYRATRRAKDSLPDVKEMTDRTEGKAPQAIDLTSSDGSMTPTVIIESMYGNKPNFRPDNSAAQADELAEDSSAVAS